LAASQHTPRILLVDDDPPLLRLVSLALMTEGFQVTAAEDGLRALEQLESSDFEVIILDLQMPRMDGRTFYREMRGRGVQTAVLILSALWSRISAKGAQRRSGNC
jgi:DNA-binding response OmpR family regulator